MKRELIFSQSLRPFSVPGTEGVVLSQCIRAGYLAYLNGQSGVGLDGRLVGPRDAAL